jgi:hypothetical protein
MARKWDSLYIYCFSGTGNALASSYWIAEEAEKMGIKAIVQEMIKTGKPGFLRKKIEHPLLFFVPRTWIQSCSYHDQVCYRLSKMSW